MVNKKFSYKSFKRQDLKLIKSAEFNNSDIIGSSFCQDKPFTDVFPVDISGVIFTRCNMDNCNIPAGAIVNGGTNKHFLIQNDQEYWIVGKDLKPVEPCDRENFIKCGLSIDPKDIPKEVLVEPITYTNDPEKIENDKIRKFLADPAKVKEAALKVGK